MVINMVHSKFFVIFLLVGCGEAFDSIGARDLAAGDGGPIESESDAGGEVSAGGAAGTGGEPTTGGAVGTGGKTAPGEPPCCVDTDCPTSLPVCTPWGTCGPGGDPYSCNYDFHCESYCYHCVGTQGGTCTDEKSCDCV